MVIGLVFFIRASTKDRIEVMQLGATQAAGPLQQDVLNYFRGRAYRSLSELKVGAVNRGSDAPIDDQAIIDAESLPSDSDVIIVIGMVSPSIYMAVFLSSLALIGFSCRALILTVLLPVWGRFSFGLALLSPLAGVFYWKKSSRPEEVTFKVEPVSENNFSTRLTVQGHRDELAELRNAFSGALSPWK